MFGMSAERSGVERPARIAQCGHAPEALRRRTLIHYYTAAQDGFFGG